MKAGVVVFPGTNCDRDTFTACEAFGWETEYIWHVLLMAHVDQFAKTYQLYENNGESI